MSHRKRAQIKQITAALLAALLLVLVGCSAGAPAAPEVPTPPTVTIEPVAPIPPTSPEPEVSEPVTSPEPEVSEPVTPPEPEVSEPITSPNPEVSEPVTSPEPEVSEPTEEPTPVEPEPAPEPQADEYGIYSPRVGLYDAQTLTAIHEKEADVPMATASMSKIVTALTALRHVSPDTVFTVGTELQLVQPGASISFIAQGHRLTLKQLLMGLLLPSGCDAAYTIAVNVAREVSGNPAMGDQEAVVYFSGLMNDLASELGAVNSHFVNPDGWDHEEHYSTVRDMAIFAARAMGNETIREIVSTPEQWVMFVSGENITWRNSNSLLHPESPFYHPGALGLKTGTTTEAGNCLLGAVELDGTLYITVVSGSPTRDGRYADTLKLLELIP